MRTIYITAEVDVDPVEVLERLSNDEVQDLFKRHLDRGVSVPLGMGDGDPTRAQIIERAYAAARNISTLPREIADLFWHVHGRAV